MPPRDAGALFVCLVASCSSTGNVSPPSLTGEWQEVSDSGGAQFMFFDTDGTCGERNDHLGQSYCQPCTYRYEGGSIYITDVGGVRNMPVILAYDTLTVRGLGVDPDVVYARESTAAASRCP